MMVACTERDLKISILNSMLDTVPVRIDYSGSGYEKNLPVTLRVSFGDKTIQGLAAEHLAISNASVLGIEGGNGEFSLSLQPQTDMNLDFGSEVRVELPFGRIKNAADQPNAHSNVVTFRSDIVEPQVIIEEPSNPLGSSTHSFVWNIRYQGVEDVSLIQLQDKISFSGNIETCSWTLSPIVSQTWQVTLTGCSALSGSVAMAVGAGSASDRAGNIAKAKVSAGVSIDNVPPFLSLSGPSPTHGGRSTEFIWNLSVTELGTKNLTALDISLRTTPGLFCSIVNVNPSSSQTYQIKISGCVGSGTIEGINIAAGAFVDFANNSSTALVSEAAATVDGSSPVINISSPSPAKGFDVETFEWVVSAPTATTFNLQSSDLEFKGSGASGCMISVIDSSSTEKKVRISSCSMTSSMATLAFRIPPGVAHNAVGNPSESTDSPSAQMHTYIMASMVGVGDIVQRTGTDVARSFNFNLQKPFGFDVKIRYRLTSQSTASNPADHDINSTGVLSIPAGSTSASINYTVKGSVVAEDKIVELSLDGYDSGMIGGFAGSPIARTLFDARSRVFQQVSASVGGNYSCAIDALDKLYCWGENHHGQLGDDSYINRNRPVPVDASSNYMFVSVGSQHSCGITDTKVLKCWGANNSFQLGDDTTVASIVPKLIDGGSAYRFVSAGSGHTCGITELFELKCWGDNTYGQVGNGTMTMVYTPTVIDNTLHFITVAAGYNHTCAISNGNQLYCWGANHNGQVGNNTLDYVVSTPQLIDASESYLMVAVGATSTCAVTAANRLKCWGYNMFAQVEGGNQSNILSPMIVDPAYSYKRASLSWMGICGVTLQDKIRCWGMEPTYGIAMSGQEVFGTSRIVDSVFSYKDVSVSEGFACGLTLLGHIKCWGHNDWGQLGIATVNESSVPHATNNSGNIRGMAFGYLHSCFVDKDKKVNCSGKNEYGQVGDGSFVYRASSVNIKDLTEYLSVDSDSYHTCGLTTDEKIKCWGRNENGQLGNQTTQDSARAVFILSGESFKQVEAGRSHTCGLTKSNKVRCWGGNARGQLGIDSSLTMKLEISAVDDALEYSQLALGGDHSCGLTTAGVVKCWGDNYSGELGDGSTTMRKTPVVIDSGTQYKFIEAAGSRTCGLTMAGAIKCWGYNAIAAGQNSMVPTLVSVSGIFTKLSVGPHHACALKSDGKVACWGSNSFGQLGNDSTENSFALQDISDSASYQEIKVAENFSCGRTLDNQIKCWGLFGYNSFIPSPVPIQP